MKKEGITLIILIVIFFLIAFNLKGEFLSKVNLSVNQLMSSIQFNPLIISSKIISNILETFGIILITLIFSAYLFLTKRKKESIIFILIVGFSSITGLILKSIYHISRPANALISETDFSFPSGHSSIAVIFFGFLGYFLCKKYPKGKLLISTLSITGIFLVAFSRLYLNVHWFSDVIGGLILGSIWMLIALILLKK